MKNQSYTATTMAGLEEILARELIEIGADEVQIGRRSVYFKGDLKLLYKANYCLRTALRILIPIDSYKIFSADDLYQRGKKFQMGRVVRLRPNLCRSKYCILRFV